MLVIGNGMPDARMVDEILDRKVVEKGLVENRAR